MPKKPSLLPREHGAYAELIFPLVTGLALTSPSLPSILLGAAAVLFFLAHEPAAILMGARGKRLKDQLGEGARFRGALLLGLASGLGFLGMWKGGTQVWLAAVVPMAAAALLVPLVLTGRQKTLFGEFVVLTTFSTLLLPLASASGADMNRAGVAAGVWWISFALGTLEVHAIKARIRDTARSRWTRWGSPLISGVVVGGAVFLALGQGGFPELAGPAAALIPPSLAVFSISLARVHPRHLKRVGWSLVAVNSLVLILLLQG